MKIISHRGNIDGLNSRTENNPDHIGEILFKYDCEIDVWYGDGWFLGHDNPVHRIDYNFLFQNGLWVHTKNIAALDLLRKEESINYFWHESDKYTLTSHKYIWAYPGEYSKSDRSIAVMPELHNTDITNFYGICTDYALRYENDKVDSI